MANLDITKISDLLTDAAIDANELANDKSLRKLIDRLDVIRKECAAFDGDVARVMPIKIQVEIDSLKNLHRQINLASSSVATGLKNLVDYLDAIPIGQLRKKSFSSTETMAQASSAAAQTANIDNNGVEEQTPVAAPNADTDTAPKSALLKQESTDFWSNVRANVKRESYSYQRDGDIGEENGGVEFGRIKESLKGHIFDLGELNNIPDETSNVPGQGGSSEWRSILSSLNESKDSLNINDSISHNWDGKIDRGNELHMVNTEFNTAEGLLGLGKMQESTKSGDDLLSSVNFVD